MSTTEQKVRIGLPAHGHGTNVTVTIRTTELGKVEQVMKMPSAALLLIATALVAPGASAQGISVVSLTDLHESSHLAQFKEEAGDCHFYGAIDHTEGDVHIEVRTCPEAGGALIEKPYPAIVEIDDFPMPAGTQFYLKQ